MVRALSRCYSLVRISSGSWRARAFLMKGARRGAGQFARVTHCLYRLGEPPLPKCSSSHQRDGWTRSSITSYTAAARPEMSQQPDLRCLSSPGPCTYGARERGPILGRRSRGPASPQATISRLSKIAYYHQILGCNAPAPVQWHCTGAAPAIWGMPSPLRPVTVSSSGKH